MMHARVPAFYNIKTFYGAMRGDIFSHMFILYHMQNLSFIFRKFFFSLSYNINFFIKIDIIDKSS